MSFAYAWDWVVCAKFPLLPVHEAKKVGNCCSTTEMRSDPQSRFAASKICKCMQGFHTVDEWLAPWEFRFVGIQVVLKISPLQVVPLRI